MPSRLPYDVRKSLEPIRLLILDVDGVLTDGSLIYGPDGDTQKVFNARDGLGIRLLMDEGLKIGIISGRSSSSVKIRMRELGLDDSMVILGSRDKKKDMAILQKLAGNLGDGETAVIGDDLPDLPMLVKAGFSACPADASTDVAAICDLVCGSPGGSGVVREIAELILKAKGRWSGLMNSWKSSNRE